MTEPDRSIDQEINPEWAEKIRSNLEDALTEEMYPFFDKLVNISPNDLTYEEDSRTFEEATPREREFLVRALFETIGFEPSHSDLKRTYQVQTPDPSVWHGVAEVKVFQTARQAEDQYLHEIHFPDGRIEYAVAPFDKNI